MERSGQPKGQDFFFETSRHSPSTNPDHSTCRTGEAVHKQLKVDGVFMPYHECPSFFKCSANVCPLDPDEKEKFTLKGEEICHAELPTRQRIAQKYPDLLPHKGFKQKEWQNQERWRKLPQEVKDKILHRLEVARATNLSKRGKNAKNP